MQSLVLSDDELFGARARRSLLREGVQCPPEGVVPLGRAAEIVAETRSDLLFLGLSPDPRRAVQVLGGLNGLTHAPVLAAGPAADPKFILQTLRAGAAEYLDENELETEIVGALARFRSGPAAAPPGRLTAVLGASGGCGASTLAANLAVALARDHGRALLVDLKLDTGDLAALLDVRPAHTLADLCQHLPGLDRSVFEGCLARHDSGVHLLASPRRQASVIQRLTGPSAYAGPESVTPEGVREALGLGRSLFPHVVVDVHPSFREEQLQALHQAETVLLVVRLDFTSLRNARRVLDHLGLLGVARECVRVVVNRAGQPKEVPAAKAPEALGLPVAHSVPDDPATVNRAGNYGIPAVLSAPRAKFSRGVAELARAVHGR